MEALAAIGLASSIVQFVDFSSKIVARAVKIYSSASGMTAEFEDIEVVTEELCLFTRRLRDPAADRLATDEHSNLLLLRSRCVELCKELEQLVQGTKARKAGSRISSLKASVKGLRQEKKLEELQVRLDRYRAQILGQVLEMLRCDETWQTV